MCFLDVEIDGSPAGRVWLELFSSSLPRTSANFCKLCKGDSGRHPLTAKPLAYKGSLFHRVVKGSFVQASLMRYG